MTFEGHNILSVLLTFRTFTTEPSGIAATCTPGDPMRASQFFRTGTGHRAERRPLASSNTPASRIPCGERFFDASYGRSLSLRPSRLFASLSDRTRGTSSSQPTEAFTSPLPDAGSPRHPWGYDYDAKLRIAPAGLPPASSAASLAAPAPSQLLHKNRPAGSRRSVQLKNPL